MNEKVISYIDSIRDRVVEYRRDFHKYSEVGWTEFRTASIIAKKLSELGFDVSLGKDVIKDEDRMALPAEEGVRGASRINVGRLESGTDRNVIAEDSFMKMEIRGETNKVLDYFK